MAYIQRISKNVYIGMIEITNKYSESFALCKKENKMITNYKEIEWEGFSGIEFDFDGTPAKLIRPSIVPNGKWAYKTEYFGAFPSLEIELLRRGWHIAYNTNFDRWAQPRDLERKCRFIDFVSDEFGLEKRCAMVGMSCGGMYAVKLTALLPDKVSALYLDAPVINLLSCPCGLGIATNQIYDEFVLKTGKTVVDMLSYREHPLDKLGILTDNKIPVILVAGDSDYIVPFAENGALLEAHYRTCGGVIETYIKKGCAHHPHGLDDPTVIADFIEKHSM